MRIVLTGASAGIGRHLAGTLVDSNDVWGIARNESALNVLKNELGSRFSWSSCDVSSWSNLESVVGHIETSWPSVDALICCAGVVTPIGPAMEADPESWSHTVRVNLDGVYFTIRSFFDLLMASQSRAKLICFSGGGATGPRKNFTPYAAAKAGVVRLVETLSEEWIGMSIDINAVAPGAISTAMTEAVIDAGPKRAGEVDYSSALQRQDPAVEALERVAGLVNYLLSAESDGISGKLISAVWDPWQELADHGADLKDSDIYTLRRITPSDRGFDW